jgi:putative transposase
MNAVVSLGNEVGIRAACCALDVSRAGFYRWRAPGVTEKAARPAPPLALSSGERSDVLGLLHEGRFVDKAPQEIYATLLDEKNYICSIRTMYRILESEGEVKERRHQLSRPHYEKPELLATGPNEVWSWDITKLKGPVTWTYYYLYVIMDIFSRYVVGWMVAHRELAALARTLIEETMKKQSIEPGQLLIHADRGSSMTSKPVAFLLADLGVTKSHSRPSVSNDNPYSESQFKTMKYRPEFPERFGSIEHARAFCQTFFPWYNTEHYHSGLGLLTPEDVHYGRASRIIEAREEVLLAAYGRHPERFKGKVPKPIPLPREVWINKPSPTSDGEIH